MAFECPRRSSPPSPMFDADTGCIATDPAPSARRRFRSKTGIENLPANEHAQETPHTPSPTRTTRRIQSGCAGSRPRLRDGMPGSPSQHIDITRAKWIPYSHKRAALRRVKRALTGQRCSKFLFPDQGNEPANRQSLSRGSLRRSGDDPSKRSRLAVDTHGSPTCGGSSATAIFSKRARPCWPRRPTGTLPICCTAILGGSPRPGRRSRNRPRLYSAESTARPRKPNSKRSTTGSPHVTCRAGISPSTTPIPRPARRRRCSTSLGRTGSSPG